MKSTYKNKINFFKNFITLIFSFIFIFFFIEITLRIFTPNILQERLNANVLNEGDFRRLWDQSKFHFEINSIGTAKHNEYEHKVNHDDIGFRNTCLNNTKKPSKMLLIGDSFFYGLGVKNNETISCHLTKLDIPTYSLSVPGMDILSYLQLIEKNLKSLTNKNYIDKNTIFILEILLGNDFESIFDLDLFDIQEENLNSFSFDAHASELEKIIIEDPLFLRNLNAFFRRSFLSKSYLLNYTKVILVRSGIRHRFRHRELSLRMTNMPNEVYGGFGGLTYYVKNAQIDKKRFFNGFKKLILFLQHKSNNNFAIIMFPNPAEIDSVRLENIAKISNFKASDIDTNFKYDLILEACAKFNIRCLDTIKILNSKDFYKYDNHLNRLGTEKIANFLYKEFVTLKF